MRRRSFVRAALAAILSGSAWGPIRAHTPFNQWVVYRRKHLLIGCHKQDLQTYALAKQIVDILGTELPAAKARIARAPNPGRLASLLGTDQLDVSLLDYDHAVSMAAGTGKFKPYGKIDLATLYLHSKYVLVGRTELPAKHAWLITRALDNSILDTPAISQVPPLSWHPGTNLYLEGKPLPAN